MGDRPEIPRPLRRKLMVEAGHRCAIPTCRATSSLEANHIEEWSKVKEHAFENMIILCANCHGRYTKKEIDELAMKQYKANLSDINSRFSKLERRLIDRWAPIYREVGYLPNRVVTLPIYSELFVSGLVDAGYLEFAEKRGFADKGGKTLEPAIFEIYRWTNLGYGFLMSYLDAEELM